MSPTPSSILISRTDAIGDVVLTLPVAAVLKERFPNATIGFLARPYTHAVLEACPHVDEIVSLKNIGDAPSNEERRTNIHALPDTRIAPWAKFEKWEKWDAIIHVFPNARIAAWAERKEIPLRIGTTSRLYHWWNCNRLVPLSRKRSDLHEAQLNLKLLRPLDIKEDFPLEVLRGLKLLAPPVPLPDWVQPLLQPDSRNIILHPTSMGSAREWGLENFWALARKLAQAGHTVFITGTQKDQSVLQPMLAALGGAVHDLSGKLSLQELIAFIAACDALVAGSTGPLHLASALGIVAIGLYPAERPMHAGRWAPIGPRATHLTAQPLPKGATTGLPGITVEAVFQHLQIALADQQENYSRIV